ncbi:glycosyltransferase [Rhodococcus sp. BP-332]|uniref:glycosyltransferase n=1 Tax=Rhodococcus sp. BP-332 TaxID=2739447 RepID=UPI001C9A6CC5|nr:glycosyltransferase [Rhodococcus sp. BP-332]MBY6678743.1 glycosyltransferase [Rhodococcus sp. BP-332]
MLSADAEGLVSLVWIGRISSQKNFKMFLELVSVLREQGALDRACVFGAVDEDMQSLITDPAFSKSVVEFYGFTRDYADLVPRNSVFCLFSHFEGRPLAIGDALALGLPVLASRLPGVAMSVGDGYHLVSDVAEAASACSRLKHVDERARMVVQQKAFYESARASSEPASSAQLRVYRESLS